VFFNFHGVPIRHNFSLTYNRGALCGKPAAEVKPSTELLTRLGPCLKTPVGPAPMRYHSTRPEFNVLGVITANSNIEFTISVCEAEFRHAGTSR
jgi:hypothetical protein